MVYWCKFRSEHTERGFVETVGFLEELGLLQKQLGRTKQVIRRTNRITESNDISNRQNNGDNARQLVKSEIKETAVLVLLGNTILTLMYRIFNVVFHKSRITHIFPQ